MLVLDSRCRLCSRSLVMEVILPLGLVNLVRRKWVVTYWDIEERLWLYVLVWRIVERLINWRRLVMRV